MSHMMAVCSSTEMRPKVSMSARTPLSIGPQINTDASDHSFHFLHFSVVQVRYQNVLSSVIIPHANSDPISDSTSEILQRRGLTPTRSKLFSYFSTPPSTPSSPTPHATPTRRTPLGETTDAPKFRPAYWSDNTIQYLTEQNKPYRAISPHAYKVLDAPEIEVRF